LPKLPALTSRLD